MSNPLIHEFDDKSSSMASVIRVVNKNTIVVYLPNGNLAEKKLFAADVKDRLDNYLTERRKQIFSLMDSGENGLHKLKLIGQETLIPNDVVDALRTAGVLAPTESTAVTKFLVTALGQAPSMARSGK